MNSVIGINGPYHEGSAALLQNGDLVAFCEEERLSRVKHSKPALVANSGELPVLSLEYCLQEGGLTWADVEHVAYAFLPEERFTKNVEHRHPIPAPRGDFGDFEGESAFRRGVESVPGQLADLGFKGEFHWIGHHLCHAASAYYPSGFTDASVLVVDGIGEWASASLCHGRGDSLEPVWELGYPHSLGFLWEKICQFLGFNSYDAGKVMGLAGYGDATRFSGPFEKLCRLLPDGGFRVDESILLPRNPEFGPLQSLFGVSRRSERIRTFSARTDQDYADIVASLQKVTEDIMLGLGRKAISMGLPDRLCLAGGVALNCVANARLLESGMFRDVFIQPAAHDSGTAIGAAQCLWHQKLDGKPRWTMKTPFLGPQFDERIIRQTLDAKGLKYTESHDIELEVAQLLADGMIVAWYQRRLEVGPRALGHRSILADPRGEGVCVKLNAKIKFRERFRPFCPSVLEEHLDEWFYMPGVTGNAAAHMLAAFRVREAKASQIPAVVHVDGTCRLQALSVSTTPHFHRLVKEFYRITGVPMVLNTSFNKAEPMVCRPEEAVETLLNTEIDFLAMGNFLIDRKLNLVDSPVPNIPLDAYFEALR